MRACERACVCVCVCLTLIFMYEFAFLVLTVIVNGTQRVCLHFFRKPYCALGLLCFVSEQ